MSFTGYPEYKDSGVEWLGEVPSAWSIGRLKHLLRIQGGQDYKAVESVEPTDYPVIGSGGQFTYATSYLYDGESVLLGRKGTIDKPLYIKGKFWTVDTMFYTEVLPEANGRYAYYAATIIPFSLYSTNTALPSMSQFDLANHAQLLPSYQEQTQIAAFLDHETARIDALIAEQKRLIALLKEKRQAVISHAVTKGLDPDAPMKDSGVEWLGEVPAHWDVRKFYYGIEKIIDNRGRSPSYVDDGVPILEAKQLSYGGMDCASDFDKFISRDDYLEFIRDDVLSGDVLMVTVGSVGKVGVVDDQDEFVILQNIVGYRVSEDVEPGFLGVYLKSDAAFYAMQATNKDNILSSVKVSDYVQHKMPLPPRGEQLAVTASVLGEVARLEFLQKEAESLCTTLLELRSALISAAVTGKIDVRGWQPPDSSVRTEAHQTEAV